MAPKFKISNYKIVFKIKCTQNCKMNYGVLFFLKFKIYGTMVRKIKYFII